MADDYGKLKQYILEVIYAYYKMPSEDQYPEIIINKGKYDFYYNDDIGSLVFDCVCCLDIPNDRMIDVGDIKEPLLKYTQPEDDEKSIILCLLLLASTLIAICAGMTVWYSFILFFILWGGYAVIENFISRYFGIESDEKNDIPVLTADMFADIIVNIHKEYGVSYK